MKFAFIRISTTIINKQKKTKKNKKIKIQKNSIKKQNKKTYIVNNNRDFTAYKMLFWISTVFNLKTLSV